MSNEQHWTSLGSLTMTSLRREASKRVRGSREPRVLGKCFKQKQVCVLLADWQG